MTKALKLFSNFLPLLLAAILFACEAPEKAPSGDQAPTTQPADGTARATSAAQSFTSGSLEIRQVSSRDDMVPGPWAQGHFGDWILATDKFKAIIAGVGVKAPMPRTPAGVLDAVRKDNPYEQLDQIEPTFYIGEQLDLFSPVEAVLKTDGDAKGVVFNGTASDNKHIRMQVGYFLDAKNPDVIRMTTTLTNETTQTLYNASIGDRVSWATYVPLIQLHGIPNPNMMEYTRTEWIGGRIDDNSLGLLVAEGEMEGAHISNLSNTRYHSADTYEFRPGQSISASRTLFIGGKDFSEFTNFALRERNHPVGKMSGTVLDLDKKPVAHIPVRVDIYKKPPPGDPKPLPATPWKPYTVCYTNENGEYEFDMPAGWNAYAQPFDLTRKNDPYAFSFTAAEGRTVKMAPMYVSGPSTLTVTVLDQETSRTLPAKIQITRIAGAPVDLGPPYSANGFRDYAYVPKGKKTIQVPYNGRYEVLATRGPEYTVERKQYDPVVGGNVALTFSLKRVIDTKGYVGVDLAVETSAGNVSRVSPRDMVEAAACEGVEWIVSADINKATDLAPAIEEAGLREWIGSSIGMQPLPAGSEPGARVSLFPIEPSSVPSSFRPAYLQTNDPAKAMAGLRKAFPNSLMTLHMPYEMAFGYIRNMKGSLLVDGKLNPNFFTDFDLYEILNGRQYRNREQAFTGYNRLTLQGKKYTLAGSSFSRDLLGNEPGYPRTYVAVPDDDPAKVTEEQIIAGLRKGDVVVSNGPFVKIRALGKRPGELVQTVDGKLPVDLEIWGAPWMPIGNFYFNRDTQAWKWGIRFPTSEPQRMPFKQGYEQNPFYTMNAKNDMTIQLIAWDTAGPRTIISAVQGRNLLDFPIYAISGPIYVDADGDGKYSPPPGGKPRIN